VQQQRKQNEQRWRKRRAETPHPRRSGAHQAMHLCAQGVTVSAGPRERNHSSATLDLNDLSENR
jgi:hypothetical protein